MSKRINDLKEYFNFDIYADIYDKTRDVSKSFTALIQLIFSKAGFKRGDRPIVFEAGSGTGIVLEFISKLSKIYPRYIGIDISKKMLYKLKKKYSNKHIGLILADAYSLPFKDNIFDLALMVRTIHILSKWKDAILEIKRCIKKDQLFIIVTGGSGLKILNKCISNDKYIELREKYHYPIYYYGADWEEVHNFLEDNLKANLEIIQGSYTLTKNIRKAIFEFENQLMTWHTQVPKDIHNKIISELKDYLLEKYKSLNFNEEQIGYYTIAFIKF
ncbi:MAG: methyltransferase domain-containing protein [Candidatus Helarchaeota archaeon]